MKSYLFILLLSVFSLYGAEVKAGLSADSVSIGEPVFLTVTITHDSNEVITPLDTAKWQGSFRIRDINISNLDTVTTISYKSSFYDAPIATVPNLKYLVTSKDSTDTLSDTITFDTLKIKVQSSFADGDSLKEASFHKPMKAGNFPYWIFITVIIGIILIFFLVRYLINRDGGIIGKKAEAVIPPYAEALLAIDNLKRSGKIDRGEYKDVVFTLSEILKRYISRRYSCKVQEHTSLEFKSWIKKSPLTKEQKNRLTRFVNDTEPIKFANIIPTISTIEEWIDEILEFFYETKPEEVLDDKEAK